MEICFYVQEEFDVVYSVKGITSLLHQLGCSYKKPKKVPGKVNKEKQQEFIAFYRKIKKGRIYFMDGVHSLHNVQPAFGWIKKGKEQVIKTNTGRKRININGAYDIEEHKVIIREGESINAQSTIKLLK